MSHFCILLLSFNNVTYACYQENPKFQPYKQYQW